MAGMDGAGAAAAAAAQTAAAVKQKASLYNFVDPAAIQTIRGDAGNALSAIRGVRSGGTRDKSGMVGAYRESMMARALQAYLSMIGVGGFGAGGDAGLTAANQGLQGIAGGGANGDFLAPLRAGANKMLTGIDFSNLDSSQILDILGVAKGAAGMGLSPMANYGNDNAFSDLQDRANTNAQQGGVGSIFDQSPNSVSDFQKLIQQYLAVK